MSTGHSPFGMCVYASSQFKNHSLKYQITYSTKLKIPGIFVHSFSMNTKTKMFVFKKNYFILTLLLFAVEVFIALFIKDRIIRPYGGDLLVVILIYYFLRSFWNQSPGIIALVVLLFSFSIEFLQYFKLVELLGLSAYPLARIVIGTSFHWLDLVAYAIGVAIVYAIDRKN